MCLAIPGRIEAVDERDGPLARTASVSFAGVVRTVNVALVPEATVGDYVLVHVGIALQRVDEAEARRTFALLDALEQPADAGAEEVEP
ncbi:MAG: HypC/HybG/HupF family hydrogenase formation chaperone [Myxococcales bacterium]|nr:HypC/HybG/HupF family hydrogenase formation chaperone [Myxococcales bacterium]MCB9754606.1 HypC/HybG/HupF family hydrogenase formation chaperone [Myxococcales bacterium]